MVMNVDVFAFDALIFVDFDVDGVAVVCLQSFGVTVDDPIIPGVGIIYECFLIVAKGNEETPLGIAVNVVIRIDTDKRDGAGDLRSL